MRHIFLIAIPLLLFYPSAAQQPADSARAVDTTKVVPKDEPPDVTNVVNEEELRRRGMLRDTGAVVEVEDILPGARESERGAVPEEAPPEKTPREEPIEPASAEPDSARAAPAPDETEKVREEGLTEEGAEQVVSPRPQEPEEKAVLEEEDILEEFAGEEFSVEEGEESLFEEQPVPAPEKTGGGGAAVEEIETVEGEPGKQEPEQGIEPFEQDRAEEAIAVEQSTERELPARPARVESVHSIDFARNLQEYRSPKLAMLLSLLVPGAGQAYARNYWKTALFGVFEAAVIGVSVGYNIKGRNETRKAHRFADKYYNADDFKTYYDSLRSYLKRYNSDPDSITDEMVDSWMDEIFFAFEDESFIDTFMNDAAKGTNGFYNRIGELIYVQGWDDCEPELERIEDAHLGNGESIEGRYGTYVPHTHDDSTYLVYRVAREDTSTRPMYGYSRYQLRYNDIMSVASSYYSTSINVLFLLLANHIASAIDAGITAKQHNDRLLGKQSLWDRIEIERRWVNTGSEMAPGYAVKINF